MQINKRAVQALAGVGASLVLAACGGDGGPDSNGGGFGASAPYVLFATDVHSGAIAGLTTANPGAGVTLSAHILESDEGGVGIAYDGVHDDLYAVRVSSDDVNVNIDVFAKASHLVAGARPSRTLTIAGFVPAFTTAIAIDTASNSLWIGGLDSQEGNMAGRITVLAQASNLNGTVTPTRDISFLPDFSTFALDTTHDMLYLAGGGGVIHGVYAFAGASTLTTGAPVTRTIDGVDGTGSFLISVDAQRDILYVPSAAAGLGIVRAASNPTPVVGTLEFPSDTSCCVSAAVDSRNDRLYVGSYTNAYVLNNASTLTAGSSLPAASVTQPGASIFAFAFP